MLPESGQGHRAAPSLHQSSGLGTVGLVAPPCRAGLACEFGQDQGLVPEPCPQGPVTQAPRVWSLQSPPFLLQTLHPSACVPTPSIPTHVYVS
jgi:hypothetical protein